MTTGIDFGFLPEDKTYTVGRFSISPLPTIAATVRSIMESDRTDGLWYYPPLVPFKDYQADGRRKPVSNAVTFELPATHSITPGGDRDVQLAELAEFLILVFGFLKGLRLIPQGWRHFYRTAIKPGHLVDFRPSHDRAEEVLHLACDLWLGLASDPPLRRRYFGAFHWFLFAQSYTHPFELFHAQYIVLDTCWHIYERRKRPPQRTKHTQRLPTLCEAYGLAHPTWPNDAGELNLTTLRNELVHEGLYGGEPIGFANTGTDIEGMLAEFNGRLLLALLGLRHPYLATPIGSRELRRLE